MLKFDSFETDPNQTCWRIRIADKIINVREAVMKNKRQEF